MLGPGLPEPVTRAQHLSSPRPQKQTLWNSNRGHSGCRAVWKKLENGYWKLPLKCTEVRVIWMASPRVRQNIFLAINGKKKN